MKFMTDNKIRAELINPFNEEMTFDLAKRLEDDNCQIPFDRQKDRHLLRALTLNRPVLSVFIYPLDQEHFDEN